MCNAQPRNTAIQSRQGWKPHAVCLLVDELQGANISCLGQRKSNSDSAHCTSEDPQPLKLKLSQAGSAVFLAAAIYSFPPDVDKAYAIGAYCNMIISMYHHGLMIQTRPPHTSAWRFKFDCTDVDEARSGLRLLRVVDQAFVAYICLHTGLSGRGIPDWAVIMVCLVSALGGMPFVGFVITVALYLTVPKLADISEVQQAQFALAALGGPIVFLYMYKIGAWCSPYRYLWHLCCGCLISIGGTLNTSTIQVDYPHYL